MVWTYQGKEVEEGHVWIDVDGIHHSPQWNIWTSDEKIGAGLVEVGEEVPERTLADAKTEKITKIKVEQRVRLSGTDWTVVRKADTGTAIPAEIQDHRDAIRAKGDEMEAAINALDTVSAVDAFNILWPELSDS